MEPYETSIGTVEGYENGCYITRLLDGRVVGIEAAGEPSEAAFEADAAAFIAANGL